MLDDFNIKLTIINEFRTLHMKNMNLYIFRTEFQRIFFDLNYVDDVFMTKTIHKLHNRIQRSIVIVFEIKNIYGLTHQCWRIYKKIIQSNKIKRVVKKINRQKKRRFAISYIIFSNVFFYSKIFVSVSFSRKILSKNKSRLFNSSSNTTFRLINKETLTFFYTKTLFQI